MFSIYVPLEIELSLLLLTLISSLFTTLLFLYCTLMFSVTFTNLFILYNILILSITSNVLFTLDSTLTKLIYYTLIRTYLYLYPLLSLMTVSLDPYLSPDASYIYLCNERAL